MVFRCIGAVFFYILKNKERMVRYFHEAFAKESDYLDFAQRGAGGAVAVSADDYWGDGKCWENFCQRSDTCGVGSALSRADKPKKL